MWRGNSCAQSNPPPTLLPTQIKGTVLLMPSGSDKITGVPLQPLQSDKSCEDEEVKALLATRWVGLVGAVTGNHRWG